MAEKKTDEKASIEELRAQVEALQQALEDARAAMPEEAEGVLAEAEAIRERVQDGLQDIQQQIDAHPVPSALLAFGLGFLIARLISR